MLRNLLSIYEQEPEEEMPPKIRILIEILESSPLNSPRNHDSSTIVSFLKLL